MQTVAKVSARATSVRSTARPSARRSVVSVRINRAPEFRSRLVTKAAQSEFDSEAFQKKTAETLSKAGATLKAQWEKTDDKPAVVVIGAAALVALIAANAVVDAVDRIPLISDAIELVGICVTGWFVYRYTVYGPDREELFNNVKNFVSKISGSSSSGSSSGSSRF